MNISARQNNLARKTLITCSLLHYRTMSEFQSRDKVKDEDDEDRGGWRKHDLLTTQWTKKFRSGSIVFPHSKRISNFLSPFRFISPWYT